MKSEDILLICMFIIVVAIFTWEMVYFAQMKRGFYCEYNGHKIEFKLGFGKGMLFIDGEQCDKQSTVFKWVLVLNGKIEEEAVELRMTTGFFRPIIKLYVGEQEFEMKKNEKAKKNENK